MRTTFAYTWRQLDKQWGNVLWIRIRLNLFLDVWQDTTRLYHKRYNFYKKKSTENSKKNIGLEAKNVFN